MFLLHTITDPSELGALAHFLLWISFGAQVSQDTGSAISLTLWLPGQMQEIRQDAQPLSSMVIALFQQVSFSTEGPGIKGGYLHGPVGPAYVAKAQRTSFRTEAAGPGRAESRPGLREKYIT